MISNKKIALLLFNYFSYGGLERDFLSVSEELLKRGFILKIFVGSWEGKKPSSLDIVELGHKGFTNHSKNRNYFKKTSFLLKSFNPDLIFGFNKIPSLDLYLAADTCFKKRRKNKNFIYKLLPRYKLYMDYENAVFGKKSKTKILLLNEKQKSEFKEEYDPKELRMSIIPPGLSDSLKVNKKERTTKGDLGFKSTDKIILFVGSDFKRKGLDRAIKALSSCLNKKDKSLFLLVAGQDDPKHFANLAHSAGVKDQVIFLGSRDDVDELMVFSDLLIHPAREEAAGNVILEAMAKELPVLTCEEVGFSGYVERYEGGTVIKNDFNQQKLNASLKNLINKEKLSIYKKNLSKFKENNYLFSRFEFIASLIERELNV
ncbi:uncharacterized protein METZ01_LOCUS72702 [marine metagenome]|uniref:Glycosyl transferase family 1 domain-containing protein n=1 Tax=marine metagenome TaxID=408172 RepID=A0A381TWI8_9ZZZZ